MNPGTLRRPILAMARSMLVVGCVASLSGGCHSDSNAPASAGPGKVKVAYLGLTCEAAMFVAQQEGFFAEEGLDVEFVRTDWDGLRDGLGLGRFDANYTLIMYLLKPIEQGLDVKITGGVHSGCLRVLAGAKTDIKTVEDLRGKRIGIPTMGSPPFLFASRVLSAHGMDPRKDVEWVVVAPDVAALALDNGQVDAVPHPSRSGRSCWVWTRSGRSPIRPRIPLIATSIAAPWSSAGPSRSATLRRRRRRRAPCSRGPCGSRQNPSAAARLSVEKKYIAASSELNARAISKLRYGPGVIRCRKSLDMAAAEMKAAGLLNPSTDPAELARKAWLDLEGVNDAWIKGLKVEHIVGGGPPPPLDRSALAAMLSFGNLSYASCCDGCGGVTNAEICSRKSSIGPGL